MAIKMAKYINLMFHQGCRHIRKKTVDLCIMNACKTINHIILKKCLPYLQSCIFGKTSIHKIHFETFENQPLIFK